MAKFLMTVWPLAGHFFPNLAIARSLVDAGHEVAFYSGQRAEGSIRAEGFRFFGFQRLESEWLDGIVYRASSFKTGSLRYLVEQRNRYREWITGRLHEQVEDLTEVLDSWAPDVIVCDPLMWAPYVVLRELRRVKVAIFAYVPFSLIPSPDIAPLGLGLRPPRDLQSRLQTLASRRLVHRMTAGVREAANRVRNSYGLKRLVESVSEYAGSMDLYLIAGTPELDYNRSISTPAVHYVGPCLWSKPSELPAPEWITGLRRDQPVVHVTEGTVHVDAPVVLNAAARGLANLNMQVVMATGSHRRPEDLGLQHLAPNVRVESWIPYDYLLPRTDLVVTTAGAGTVLAALAMGIPLVVIPTEWDKPEVARRVADAGAALFLKPSQCTPQRLRAAVETVLGDVSFRRNAERLRASFARYGGPKQVAELLTQIV